MALDNFLKKENQKAEEAIQKQKEWQEKVTKEEAEFKTLAKDKFTNVIRPTLNNLSKTFNANDYKSTLTQDVRKISYMDRASAQICVFFQNNHYQFDFISTISKTIEVILYHTKNVGKFNVQMQQIPSVKEQHIAVFHKLENVTAENIEAIIEELLKHVTEKKDIGVFVSKNF